MRLKVTVWHGESASLFYVVDTEASQDEQPAVLYTAHSWMEAVSWIDNHPNAKAGG